MPPKHYKAVTRALRCAFGVGARVMFRGSVERDAERIHLEASASRRHGRMLYPKYVFGLHDSSASGSMLFGGLRGGPFTR
jgi:hypothetical protein